MEIYNVVPHEGVEPVRLGMSRSAARAAMSFPRHSFKKLETTPEVDGYHGNSFQIFFDEYETVEYIELSAPHDGSFKAFYEGLNVHETKADEVIEFITKLADFDKNIWDLGYSYVFPTLDMCVWRPTIPEKDQEESDDEGRYFLTIGVGVPSYFKVPKVLD